MSLLEAEEKVRGNWLAVFFPELLFYFSILTSLHKAIFLYMSLRVIYA